MILTNKNWDTSDNLDDGARLGAFKRVESESMNESLQRLERGKIDLAFQLIQHISYISINMYTLSIYHISAMEISISWRLWSTSSNFEVGNSSDEEEIPRLALESNDFNGGDTDSWQFPWGSPRETFIFRAYVSPILLGGVKQTFMNFHVLLGFWWYSSFPNASFGFPTDGLPIPQRRLMVRVHLNQHVGTVPCTFQLLYVWRLTHRLRALKPRPNLTPQQKSGRFRTESADFLVKWAVEKHRFRWGEIAPPIFTVFSDFVCFMFFLFFLFFGVFWGRGWKTCLSTWNRF